MKKEFLVEIRVKDWVHLPDGVSRTIAYEEVLAVDDYFARHAGYNQFVERTKYQPIMKRKWEALNLHTADICAPDAVEI